jgi:hypothetical protein
MTEKHYTDYKGRGFPGTFEEKSKVKLLKFDEVGDIFKSGNEGTLHKLTCVNHPTAKYYSKNPFSRGLHIIEYPVEYRTKLKGGGTNPLLGEECPCPFDDLRVVVEEESNDVTAE